MSLAIEEVTKTYKSAEGRPIAALEDVSLTVDAGEFVAIMGPSGCGKTTLLLAAGGLQAPDSGAIRLGGTDIYSLGTESRARFRAQNIGFVFQQFHLVPYLSVLDNVLAPTLASEIPRARERARELLERFGLASRLTHVPAKLSTGERQRVALARALLPKPQLLLADEPTGNLDRENSDTVLSDLRDFAAGGGAVLLVTHDTGTAERADRTLQLDQGRLCALSDAGEGDGN